MWSGWSQNPLQCVPALEGPQIILEIPAFLNHVDLKGPRGGRASSVGFGIQTSGIINWIKQVPVGKSENVPTSPCFVD